MVVTSTRSADNDSIDEPDTPVGLTVGSFTSISLDPPLVGFFADHGSTTMPHIIANGQFCVNVLSTGQRDLAKAFARSGTDKFADIGWTADAYGSPRLDGAHAWLTCTVEETRSYGDHDLIVGRLIAALIPGDREPLVFHKSRFHGLGTLG